MITIQAPITIHQFDEERYARIEESIVALQTATNQMREQLQEVLTSRQSQVDELTAQLKAQNDILDAATKAIQQKG